MGSEQYLCFVLYYYVKALMVACDECTFNIVIVICFLWGGFLWTPQKIYWWSSSTHSFIDSSMLQALLLCPQVSELLWLEVCFWSLFLISGEELRLLLQVELDLCLPTLSFQPVPTSDQRQYYSDQLSFPGSGYICREKVTQMRREKISWMHWCRHLPIHQLSSTLESWQFLGL